MLFLFCILMGCGFGFMFGSAMFDGPYLEASLKGMALIGGMSLFFAAIISSI